MLFGAVLGLASFFPVWLVQPYMQANGVPLPWFGPAWAAANLSVSIGSLLSARTAFHLGTRGMTWLCLLLIAAGYLGLAFTHAVWGFAWYFLLTLMRGLQGPLIRLHLQQRSRRSERASILSLKSLLFRSGFIVAAPVVGLLADQVTLATTFLFLLGGLMLLLLPLAVKFLGSLADGESPVSPGKNIV
jgi:MFS family permease